jgi:hypothetical protein
MKKLIAISFVASALLLGQVCAAQSFNKNFAESERALASKCITTYQNAPKDGAQIVSTCKARLEKMNALKNRTAGLTDIDNRLFYLYSAMTNTVLTLGDLAQNGGRVSPAACVHGREAVALASKINFQNSSDFEATVQQMITGFKRDLIPHCTAK